MTPKYSPQVSSRVPKCKKVVICLMEKKYMLDKLHLGMSYSDVGCEYIVNQYFILNKVSLQGNLLISKVMYCLIDKNVHRGLQDLT